MSHHAYSTARVTFGQGLVGRLLAVASILAGGVVLVGRLSGTAPPAPVVTESGQRPPVPARTALLASRSFDAALDPTYALGWSGPSFGRSPPVVAALRAPQGSEAPSAERVAPEVSVAGETTGALPPRTELSGPSVLAAPGLSAPNLLAPRTPPETARLTPSVPLPPLLPPDLRQPILKQATREIPADLPPKMAEKPASSRVKTAAAKTEPADDRNIFQKLFGVGKPETGKALAYASLDTAAPALTPQTRLNPGPGVSPGGGAAVYDISARTVTMPNGEVLEAHSGLGDHMDDPRFVHVRMRGPTPPGAYELTEREALFHGVRAIRMTPVGGSAAIHGRDGILAHTYMLGAAGASNGCVSFRDYSRFLQAFLRGEVKRLVVVAGRGRGAPAGWGGGERVAAAGGREG